MAKKASTKFYTYQVLLNENLSVTTIDLYERQYRTKLAPSRMAMCPVKDITSGDIQKFPNGIAHGELANKRKTPLRYSPKKR